MCQSMQAMLKKPAQIRSDEVVSAQTEATSITGFANEYSS